MFASTGNDAPEPQALPRVLADETAPLEQIFFDLDCIDEDVGPGHGDFATYAIVGGNGMNTFAIDPGVGYLTFARQAAVSLCWLRLLHGCIRAQCAQSCGLRSSRAAG